MKRHVNIFSIVLIGVGLAWSNGCIRPSHTGDEQSGSETADSDKTGFDPLDRHRDMEVVPQKYPQPGAIHGSEATLSPESGSERSATVQFVNLPETIDTLNHQAYRIQLFTSKLYGEARHTLRVAGEIFDRPVFLDYEVPYYKVRVGSFSSRDEAEDYQQRVRAAGYPEAWVVMVNVGVPQAPLLYSDSTWPVIEDSLEYEDGFDYHD